MHLMMSLLFLLAAIALMVLYVAGPFVLFLLIRAFRRRRRSEVSGAQGFLHAGRSARHALTFLILAPLVYGVLTYGSVLKERTGSQNAYPDAKKYWATGQVVLGARLALTRFIHPENPIVWPFNKLQKMIFDVGSKQLPAEDGEIGVWVDAWFVYPYSRMFYEAKGTHMMKASPQMIPILDNAWFSIETVATKPFADKEMEREQYYRSFPRMLFYYVLKDGYYKGPMFGSGARMERDPVHVDRSKKIVQWTEELRAKWEKDDETMAFLRENPKVDATLGVARIVELGRVLFAQIVAGEFRCDDPYVERFVTTVNAFEGTPRSPSPYKRVKDKWASENLRTNSIDASATRFLMYALMKFCDKSFFLTEQQVFKTEEFGNRRDMLLRVFDEYLILIRRATDGRG